MKQFQPRSGRLHLADLKRRVFGALLGVEKRVPDAVRRNLQIWKPHGGYVFNNVHNIQAGVSVQNIVALLDAAYAYGFYG